MNSDLFKPFSFFSEPNSEENKKLNDCLADFKEIPNPNFFEENGGKDDWICQLSPTLSGINPHNNFELGSDNIQQPIVNSSPCSMFSRKVEVITLYRTSKKESNNSILILKNKRRSDVFKQRRNFNEDTANTLKKWLLDHKENPYPSLNELNTLCNSTGLTSKQIRTYFVNNRARLLFRSPKGGKSFKIKKNKIKESSQSKDTDQIEIFPKNQGRDNDDALLNNGEDNDVLYLS